MSSSHWPKRAPPQWLSSVKKGYQQLQNTISSNGFVDQFIYHPIFRFWFLVTFGDEVMKIQKYYVIFVCILLGKMGNTKKTEGKFRSKKTKNQKTKIWDERNI